MNGTIRPNSYRRSAWALLIAGAVALTLGLALPLLPGQTIPQNVQKASGTNNITADLNFATGRTLGIASGGTLSAASGSTVSIAGTLNATPTAGTVNLSAVTLTLPSFGVADGFTLTSAGSLGFILPSSGGLGIGTAGVPDIKLTMFGPTVTTAPDMSLWITGGTAPRVGAIFSEGNASGHGDFFYANAGGTTNGWNIIFRRSGGTLAAPEVIGGNSVGSLIASIYDGASFRNTASIGFAVNGSVSAGVAPQRIIFTTGQLTSRLDRIDISAAGTLRLGITNDSLAAWGNNGVVFRTQAGRTWTDTTSSGTVAAAVGSSFAGFTVAASSATTYTDAANLYIAAAPSAGTNVTITNPLALWVDDGNVRFDGDLAVNGGDITSTGAIALTAGGTNTNITLTRPGTGRVDFLRSGDSTPTSAWTWTDGSAFRVLAEGALGGPGDVIFGMATDVTGTRNVIGFRRSRGTLASPTAVQSNDNVGSLVFSAYDGSTFIASSSLSGFVDPSLAVSSGVVGTGIDFSTSTAGTGSRATHARFRYDGRLQLGVNNKSLPAWGAAGAALQVSGFTATDNSTAASGTVASAVFSSFGQPNIAASNASVTVTDAATVYIAGPPQASTNMTITSAWALWVDSGSSRFDGSVQVNGSLTGQWNTQARSTGLTLASFNSFQVNSNEGSSAGIALTLPTAAAGLSYTFVVQDADGLTITAGSGDTIRIGASVTAAAGSISSTTIGNTVTLVAINATEWIGTASTGTWTF